MTNIEFVIFQSHPVQYYAPLYKELTKNGFNLKVYYGSSHGVGNTLDKEFNTKFKWDVNLLDGYNCQFLKSYASNPGPYGFWNILNFGIIKEIISKNKKVFMVYGWNYATNLLIIILGRLFGHHVTFKAETPLVHENQRSSFAFKTSRFIVRQMLRLVNSVQYIGEQNRLFYKHMGVPDRKMLFTPYSVNNNRFLNEASALKPFRDELRDKLGIPKSNVVFLYSGKFITKKRPIDLLKSISTLSAVEKQNSYFVFMGEGKLRAEMEQVISKNSLTNIKLTGFINQSKVAEYYAACDVFVMCSGVGETWGLSSNEAMCFGLPIIISDLTGCSYDLVRENGFVFETGNISQLSSVLSKTISLSEIDLNRMGNKSQEIITNYSYDVITRNMIDFFGSK